MAEGYPTNMESLWSDSLDEALERFASAKPTPGGGAAAALSGCLGAAMLIMVMEISGRTESAAFARHLLAELKACVDADIAAFDSLLSAWKQRDDAVRAEALRRCIEVPAAGAGIILQLVPEAGELVETAPAKVMSDLGVALAQLDAALTGLLLNVDINQPMPTPARNCLAAEIAGARGQLQAAMTRVVARIAAS